MYDDVQDAMRCISFALDIMNLSWSPRRAVRESLSIFCVMFSIDVFRAEWS